MEKQRKTSRRIIYSFVVLSMGLANILSACSPFTIVSSSGQQPTPVIETETKTGSISGWVWLDQYDSDLDSQSAPTSTPPSCIAKSSSLGAYHADSILDANELPIEGAEVKLREEACFSHQPDQDHGSDDDAGFG